MSSILKDDPTLINAIINYHKNNNAELLKEAGKDLFLHMSEMEVNLLVVTDNRGKIAYQAPDPEGLGGVYQAWGLEEALAGEEILASGYGPRGWAIRALAPLIKEGKQYGVLILGVYLNDAFARKIAEATHTNISFSTPYKILASSWPVPERGKVGLPWVGLSLNEKRSFFQIDASSKTSSFHVPIDIGDETVCLVVNTDTTPIFDLLQQKKKHLLLVFLGVLLLILGFGAALTYFIIKPLRVLQQRALGMVKEISQEEIPVTRWGNEIETLSQTMDLMLAAIRAHLADLHQAQEALRDARRDWEEIFQAIGQPAFILGKEQNIITANRVALKAFKGQETEIIGRKCYEILHCGNGKPAPGCPMEKVLHSGRMETKEIEVAALNGTYLVSCTPLFDDQGNLEKIIHIATDITARKRAEESLLKYEFIANTAKDCMTLIDHNYLYEAANAAYCRAHGLTREEVVGNSVANVWGRDTFETIIKSYLDQCFTGVAVEFEGWFEFGQQGRGCYHVSYSPYFNADGTVAYVAVVSHDVTKRREAEELLREESDFSISIMESLPGVFYLFDEQGKLSRWNKNLEGISQYSALEIAGMHPQEFFTESDKPRALEAMQTCFATGEVRLEAELLSKNGVHRPFVLTGRRIFMKGRPFLVGTGLDISERRQMEETLRERESMLSLVVNTVPQVIFWKDLDSVYLGCNQHYAQAAGLETPAAVVGKTEYDLPWEPEEIEIYLAEDREVMQTRQGKYHQVETRQLADGRRIWVEGTKIPLLANDGTVMGVLGVFDNITERKRMEEELRESEISYRTLAQNLPGLVYRIFLRDRFRMEFYNDMLQSLTGYSLHELCPGEVCSLDHYIFPEDREKVRKVVKQAASQDQVFEVEYRFRHKDGSIRYFAERGKPIPGEDGKIVHIDGVIWDITESKQLEAAIQESERRFRGLVENVPMGILIVQEGQIVYQNPEQQRLFGHLKIRNCHDFLSCGHPDDLPKVEQFCQGTMNYQPQADITLRFLPLGGKLQEARPIWVNCRATVTEYRGQKAMLITMADITHTKELEQLMLIREKMASLGQVAAGIAHEIRNPLSGINVFLDGIKENFQDPQNAAIVRELIEGAQETSNRIEAVIRRVLDFSRPAELKLAPTDINRAVDNAVKLTAASLRREDITLDSDLTADLPLVPGDSQLLEQVLVNMITNAGEALKGAGGPGRIEIVTQGAQKGVLIMVQDSGPGIPSEIRDKIFDPFFTTKKDGSGIGLSLCQRIIIDHGGAIEVSSSDLGGTRFMIHLPGK